MRRACSVLCVVGAVLPFARAASAQRPPEWGTPSAREPVPEASSVPAPPPPPRADGESTWYGWQPVISDAATILATSALAGLPNQGTLTMATFSAGYGLVPPIVHLAHGRPVIAALDLAVRVSALAIGFETGSLASANCGQNNPESGSGGCQLAGAFVGAAIGALGAMVLDAAVLSWDPPAAREAPTTARGFTWSPALVWTKDHSGLGLHGTF